MASSEHNFSDALATWKEINLTELQKTLDAQGIEIVENQKESLVGRKGLADRTKDFKKISDEEKVNAFKGLLKAYQTEIDNITRRAKISENAFLSVYKILAEAPDPYPLLDVAVDQAVKVAEARVLESELHRLREDNAELKRKVSEIPSLEAARKKAEAKAETLEERMEELIKDKVTQKENELNATYDERIRNYEDRERDLQRQVTLVKNQLRELRNSNESTQAKLMDHSQRQDQEVVAKLGELDMVVADLERANSRVAAVERRNEILRAEIEAVRSGADTADRVKSLQSHISDLESELTRISSAFEAQKDHAAEAEALLRRKTDEINRELHARNGEVEILKLRLRQYADYDEIKRELEIMKYVEFAGGDDDWDEYDNENSALGLRLPNPNAEKANQQHGKSLEVLLAAKNKRMLEELTKFRILHGELEASLQSVTDELASSRAELDKQTSLNEKLENDLIQINKHTSGNNPSGINGDKDSLPASAADALAGFNLGHSETVRNGPIPFTSSADTSILPIVTSQRDRFRQRNAELEEELRKQFQIISELRTEIKSLQSDNLKLYEKVRYMQSYRDEAPSRAATSTLDAIHAGPTPLVSASVDLGGAGGGVRGHDEMGKYRARYEESMNPFEVFRGREAARAVQGLNPVERGVLTLTRHILGNRRSRTAFIVYALTLHLLVVVTTYSCATAGPSLQTVRPSLQ